MQLRGRPIGALNLFRVGVGEIGAADSAFAQAFADIATIGILQHRATLDDQARARQLTYALTSRLVLEQATGMIAERLGVTIDRSFMALRDHAHIHDVLLSDVAQSVIDGSLAVSVLRVDLAGGP